MTILTIPCTVFSASRDSGPEFRRRLGTALRRCSDAVRPGCRFSLACVALFLPVLALQSCLGGAGAVATSGAPLLACVLACSALRHRISRVLLGAVIAGLLLDAFGPGRFGYSVAVLLPVCGGVACLNNLLNPDRLLTRLLVGGVVACASAVSGYVLLRFGGLTDASLGAAFSGLFRAGLWGAAGCAVLHPLVGAADRAFGIESGGENALRDSRRLS